MNNNVICSFFGHRDAVIDKDLGLKISSTIEQLIKSGFTVFYLGDYGYFDSFIFRTLKTLKNNYPLIKIVFITPYLDPNYSKLKFAKNEFDETIYPPLEKVPKKYAILKRNKWIVDNSDFIIAYVKYPFGGARKAFDYAIKKKVPVINFAV